jgi:hypothetical protein
MARTRWASQQHRRLIRVGSFALMALVGMGLQPTTRSTTRPNAITMSASVATTCGYNCFEDFGATATSTCGACTTRGTAYTSTLPTSHYVPEDNQMFDYMDEAVWLVSKTNPTTEATETGYWSGWWPYSDPPTWVAGLDPYGTENDGQSGAILLSPMTGGKSIAAYSDQNGTSSAVYSPIGTGVWGCNCWPTVPTPRYNYAQGEVKAENTAVYGLPELNNCEPGEQFSMQYANGSTGAWGPWMSLTVAASPPYFATKQANNLYTNGGC